jgi:hypothetical protein
MLLNESIMRRMKPIIIVIDFREKGLDKTIEKKIEGVRCYKTTEMRNPKEIFLLSSPHLWNAIWIFQ